MPTELAVETFLKLIGRSGVVAERKLLRVLEELGKDPAALGDPKRIADELVARDLLTRWQADQLLAGKHRGFFLGPYRILGLLGQGGMGKVYLAEHQMMRRRCAVKVLPSKHRTDESTIVDRFYREAQAVAALDHPNIVRAYDVNKIRIKETEFHYLVMEHIEGEDLQRMVDRQGVLGYREAVNFLRQAAEGLEHAHQRGLVHRDVKPANLLVDRDGVVKILDLGLAKFFLDDEEARLSAEHGESILGTADYLAPEQARNSHTVDARADIYSLGQAGYFLLTGRPPFPKGTIAERLLAHQTKSPRPIAEDRPDAPGDLLAIIDKMTAKGPERRHQTAREVADAMDQWLRNHADDGGFSRVATLLEQASRPSSLSQGEPTRGASASSEETELELAPLDDEKPASPSDSECAAAKQAKQDDKASASSGGAPSGSAKAAPSTPQDTSKPEDARADVQAQLSGELPDLAKLENDLMSALAENDPESAFAAVSSASAPAVAGPALQIRDSKKRRQESFVTRLLNSALFWISAGALIVIVLIAALIFSGSPKEDTPGLPTKAAPEAPTSPPAEAPLGRSPEASQRPIAEKPDAGEIGLLAPSEEPREKPPDDGDTKKPSGEESAEPQRQKPEPKPEPTAPKPEPAETAEAKPVDTQALFARITELSCQFQSVYPNRNNIFNLMVQRTAMEAVESAGLTPSKGDSAVLYLTVATTTADDGLIGFVMSAELKCRRAGSQSVEVWRHQQQIGAVSPQVLRRGTVPPPLRDGVGDFFNRFVKDCRQARDGAGENRP